MRRSLPASSLVALVLLAGCSGGGTGDGGPTTSQEPSEPLPPEEDNGVFHVAFTADSPATLEVPFPHLDSCMAPQDWMAGNVTFAGGTAELRNATDGRTGHVLALSGQGQVSWSSQAALKPVCNTLRYDPWSVDPDPADGTVDVRAAEGTVTAPSVLVRWVRDNCGNATLYEGEAGSGWSSLQGRVIPVAGC
jgi:hypothetical protein